MYGFGSVAEEVVDELGGGGGGGCGGGGASITPGAAMWC